MKKISKSNQKKLLLGNVTALEFENKLILAIDARWIKKFGSNPVFQAEIDKKGNYVLVGPHVKLAPTKDNPISVTEVSADE